MVFSNSSSSSEIAQKLTNAGADKKAELSQAANPNVAEVQDVEPELEPESESECDEDLDKNSERETDDDDDEHEVKEPQELELDQHLLTQQPKFVLRRPNRSRSSSSSFSSQSSESEDSNQKKQKGNGMREEDWQELYTTLAFLNRRERKITDSDSEPDPTDFEEWDAFGEEWLEEKDLFFQNEIDTRPLNDLIEIIGTMKDGQTEAVTNSLKELDQVLMQRCISLEKVRQRDVREEEKTWVCEPILYCPAKDKWVCLKKNPEGSDLLHAVRNGSPQEIHDAVKGMKKIDISLVRDHRGRSVMHYACINGNVAALEYFGPLANALDSEGYAPIHYASYFGNRITCDRLVQLGADINMLDSPHGKTAFDYAKEGQMKCTMISLALNGADQDDAKVLATRYIETLAGAGNSKQKEDKE